MNGTLSQIRDFGDDDMSGQARRLKEDYIVFEDQQKLTIGNEDRTFFRDSILGTSATHPRTRAQERLRCAQEFFRGQFDRRRKHEPGGYVDFLRKFKRRIDRLEVMLYVVQSAAEAVRMFETVNDRGRPLTNLEKTKSILMYASYLVVGEGTRLDTLLSELNNDFSEIYGCFQDIERRLKLRDMANERGRGTTKLGRPIDRLFRVGRVGNLYPLLIASWQQFTEDHQREEILRQLEVFVFRVYRVVRRKSNTGASHMNWLAHQVQGGRLAFDDLVQELRKLTLAWASDRRFRGQLSGTDCYWNLRTRTIKYLLAQYENKRRKKEGPGLEVNLEEILSAKYETEHILPQHPVGGLDETEKVAHKEIVHRLGNLTIASKEWNRSMRNRSFEEKRDGHGDGEPGKSICYRNSALLVQSELANWEQWNEATIRERGDEIIDFALDRWRIGPATGPATEAAQP